MTNEEQEQIEIRLLPPRWWNGFRWCSILVGSGFIAISLFLVADLFRDLPLEKIDWLFVIGSVLYFLAGCMLILLPGKKNYSMATVALKPDTLVLSRRTGVLVEIPYHQVKGLFWLKPTFLRVRLHIRTEQGDFWINRFWLPKDYSLTSLAKIIRHKMQTDS